MIYNDKLPVFKSLSEMQIGMIESIKEDTHILDKEEQTKREKEFNNCKYTHIKAELKNVVVSSR